MSIPSANSSPATSASHPSLANARRNTRGQRSFAGCRICKVDKVKCDEGQPQCARCVRLNRQCDYTQVPRKKYTRRTRQAHPTVDSPEAYSDPRTVSSEGQLHAPSPDSTRAAAQDHIAEINAMQQDGSLDISRTTDSPHWSAPIRSSVPTGLTATHMAPECVAILSPSDYSAIDIFRNVVPLEADTSPAEYSGPGMVWFLAQRNTMVLHLVCALGGQKWCEMNSTSADVGCRQLLALEHYGDGLRQLREVTQAQHDCIVDIECTLATLWLMILYELKYGCGDGCGDGLNAHLCGMAPMLRGQLSAQTNEHAHYSSENADEALSDGELVTDPESRFQALTPLSCKIIVWMALLDGGARINGFGGSFNDQLGEIIPGISVDPVRSRLDFLRKLQQRSVTVNTYLWGSSYPQSRLIQDLQNLQLGCLYAECGQLRFLIGNLVEREHEHDHVDAEYRCAIGKGIRIVEKRYYDHISIVTSLIFGEDPSQAEFTFMAFFIVSFYHAVSLCFLRICNGSVPLGLKQRETIRQIMSSAFKIYGQLGSQGLLRIAWPLFVVAIESDDMVHRTWILKRYTDFVHRGENFRRARDALETLFNQQRMDERIYSYTALFKFRNAARFLL